MNLFNCINSVLLIKNFGKASSSPAETAALRTAILAIISMDGAAVSDLGESFMFIPPENCRGEVFAKALVGCTITRVQLVVPTKKVFDAFPEVDFEKSTDCLEYLLLLAANSK